MMKKAIKIICVILVVVLVLTGIFLSIDKKYERSDDTIYSVLQVTDVHILNDDKKDKKAFKTITAMVEKTEPDLIVVTGDVTSEHENLLAIKKFGEFMEKFNLPWAFTYGNHDAEGASSKDEIDQYLLSLKNCVYETGDKAVDGHGNYYRNITDKNGKVVMSLFMMDSNMYEADGDGYDHFHDNQIEWYKNSVKTIATEINGDESKVVPSLAFFHIPMQEFAVAHEEAKGSDARISGFRFEEGGFPKNDDMMFETMLELGSTKGVFAGHDHMNDFTVNYKGIRLSYGNSCDHNIYVVPRRGGNLIEIKADGTFTSAQVFRHRFSNNANVQKAK